MKSWQFNILFGIAALGAVFLLFAPLLGVDLKSNQLGLTGYGAILTYVLTQRGAWTKHNTPPDPPPKGADET